MHTEITLNTSDGKIFTVFYDGVQFVDWDSSRPNYVQVKLCNEYTARGLRLEYQTSTIPYLHVYDCVAHIHVSYR